MAGRHRHPLPESWGMTKRYSLGPVVLLAALLAVSAAGVADDGPTLQESVEAAYHRYLELDEGELADYIPALAQADPDDFGIVVVTAEGERFERGDTGKPFAIMSAAKPFTLALVMQQRGRDVVIDRIGVDPTGQPFNSLSGIDPQDGRPLNPMVNAGAITAVSLVTASDPDERWSAILGFYDLLAGDQLSLMNDVYKSVSTSNYRNRAIVSLLRLSGRLGADPDETLDVYNKQSCVAVTAGQLAVMGATLANGGINPLTNMRVLGPDPVRDVLAVMMMNGMYDESGIWAVRAGLPAKSGVGGGIVAVVPGRLAIVAYSPRLSESGNSVRAMRAIEDIAREQRLSIVLP